MKKLVSWFVRGLIFIVPIAVTLFVLYKIFVMIDKPLRGVFEFPGLGFLAAIVVTAALFTVAGFLTSNFLTKRWMRFIDGLFDRFPLVKLVHSSLKDLVSAFVGEDKKFKEPVLVTLVPESDVRVVGFVTEESLSHWGMEGHMAVYLPQSYNFAGNLVVVPRERVSPLDVPSGDVMTFVVSGGVSGGRGLDETGQSELKSGEEPPRPTTGPVVGQETI